mmetsp:Transcript_6910/g.15895  ORF Transcript_6910/g.15895 Transcript_6910/m.15895 type:complete len:315 (+) Transcript_6910:2-946(+)
MAEVVLRCVFLGLGNMGTAMCRRLSSEGVKVLAWNRSVEKANALAAEWPGVSVAETAEDAIRHPDWTSAPVLVCLPNYGSTGDIVFPLKDLKGRCLLSLCSGDPDQAREFYAKLKEHTDIDTYVDGCYAGSPSVCQAGKGLVMVSCERPQAELATRSEAAGVLEIAAIMGKLVFTGTKVGSSKALDFAVVDFYMINMLGFLSGLGMLESEGVDPELLLEQMEFRLPTFPGQFRSNLPNMNAKTYDKDIAATVATWKAFFGDRIPYLERNGLSTKVPGFVTSILSDPKVAGPDGEFLQHDANRMQELLRFPQKPE